MNSSMADDEQPLALPPQPQWKALTGLISSTKVSDDPLNDGMYFTTSKGTDSVQHLTVNGVTTSVNLWHQRMGHPSENVMKLLPSVGTAARSFNKAYNFPFPLTDTTAIPHEEFVHEDFSAIIEEAEPSSTNELNPQPEPSSTPEPTSQPESNLTPDFTSQIECHTSNIVPNNQDQNVEMGRGMRNKVPSVWLRDYIINSTIAKSLSSVTPSPQSSSVSTSNSPQPLTASSKYPQASADDATRQETIYAATQQKKIDLPLIAIADAADLDHPLAHRRLPSPQQVTQIIVFYAVIMDQWKLWVIRSIQSFLVSELLVTDVETNSMGNSGWVR
nr:Retrovirus-related Pol polyprotein from transposon RE2 [Ipomoea batatas]